MTKGISAEKKLLWVDVVRVVAIYLVILVHTATLPTNPLDVVHSWPYVLSFSISKVCVPLFVMLSGALLLGKQEPLATFFSKRLLKVFVPWVLWTFVYMAWNYHMHSIQPVNFSQWKYFFETTFLTQLWFLPLIFMLYLLTPILRLIVQTMTKSQKIYFVILWFVFVSLLPYFHTGTTFPRSEDSGLVPVSLYYSGYFILGYFLSNLKLPKKPIRRSVGIVLIGIAITFVELGLIRETISPNQQLRFFDYFAPGIVVISIGVFLFLLSFFKKYKVKKIIRDVISVVGKASLGIYIVHGLLAEVLNPGLVQVTNSVSSVPLLGGYIYAFFLFSISFLLVLLLKKIPLLKILVP